MSRHSAAEERDGSTTPLPPDSAEGAQEPLPHGHLDEDAVRDLSNQQTSDAVDIDDASEVDTEITNDGSHRNVLKAYDASHEAFKNNVSDLLALESELEDDIADLEGSIEKRREMLSGQRRRLRDTRAQLKSLGNAYASLIVASVKRDDTNPSRNFRPVTSHKAKFRPGQSLQPSEGQARVVEGARKLEAAGQTSGKDVEDAQTKHSVANAAAVFASLTADTDDEEYIDDDSKYPAHPLTTGIQPGFRIGTWRGDRIITAGNTWSHPANAEVLREYLQGSTLTRMRPLLENARLTDHGQAQLDILEELSDECNRQLVQFGMTEKQLHARQDGRINKAMIYPKLLERGLVRETESRKLKNARAKGEPYKKMKRAELEQLSKLKPTFDNKGYMSRTNELRFIPLNQLRWPGGGVTQAMWDQLTAKDRNAPPGQRCYFIDMGPSGPLARGIDMTAGYLQARENKRHTYVGRIMRTDNVVDENSEDDVDEQVDD